MHASWCSRPGGTFLSSSPTCFTRAVRTFPTLLPDTTIYVSPAPDPRYDAGRWWQYEHSLVAAFNELIKLGFYWARYGIAPVG